ncbi:MAG: hypothetical protein IJ244_00005, partial [Bacteroidaceae bacterium]|nr:hypothetical protein [Bacteroidaceae bacterium]
MKRLLTLLGVVAVLLLTPTNAKAWKGLYLLNSIEGYWEVSHKNDTYKFSGSGDEFTYTIDASNYEGVIY